MKTANRLKYATFAFAAMILWLASYLAAAPGQQPVYIYLYAKVSDHVNLAMTEDRLRHVLPEVERFRQSHPDAHVSATILFSGAVSKALQDRDGQTHVVDFVKDYIRRGVIDAGYDGTDEPTYDVRPLLKVSVQQPPQDRWKTRQTIAGEFLAEARDPLTGAPASGAGGLKEMQEVFGQARDIRGLELAIEVYRPPTRPNVPIGTAPPPDSVKPRFGVFREIGGDTETLQMLAKYNTNAIMFGIPSANPAQIPGYGESIKHFGELMGAGPDTAPEVYWQDYALRLSEAAPPVRPVKALDGVEALKGTLDKANRSTLQVVQVELGSIANYLQPDFAKTAANAPVQYAYAHPQAPQLPPEALRPTADVNAGWSKEDALLKWLTEEFFRNNAGSQFVSPTSLAKMAKAGTGFSVSTDGLRAAVADALQKLGNDNHLLDYFRVDGHYLSLAEMFQVLTDELAEFHQTGKLPQSVKVARVYGPFRLVTGHGPNVGEVTAGDVENLCAEIDGPLHDETSTGVPKNSVPPMLKLNGMDLNPAQMMRLMAQALANPAPDTKLPVRMVYTLSEAGGNIPKTRLVFDVGFVWTIKPAPLAIN